MRFEKAACIVLVTSRLTAANMPAGSDVLKKKTLKKFA
jgi:hypothetical protein